MTNSINKPFVTIGIPTYNRAESYLKQALNSAVKQNYPNIEIIVSDNCSSDNTESVVKSFTDPRIRYFKQDVNIGAINNSNFCLKQARGDYFIQLHDDDMIDHDFVEACMKAAKYSTEIGIIRTGTRVVDSENNVMQESRNIASGLSPTEFFRCWFAWKISIYLCSTVFNTKRLKEIGGFYSKHNLFDDLAVYARLAKYPRVDIEEIKASFRKHGGEETFAAKTRDWCEDSLYILDLICNDVSEQDREAVRKEGIKSLSMINYNFARSIKSPWKRLIAYYEIYRMFRYKHVPPPVYNAIYSSPLILPLRFLKRFLQLPVRLINLRK